MKTATVAAPRPEDASGVKEGDVDPLQPGLWLPRALLFVPRWAFTLIMQPFRGAVWLLEHFELKRVFQSIFFDETLTFGIYPIVSYESGFGFTGGANIVHKDLFGEKERIKLSVGYGGRFIQHYDATFSSGKRFGEFTRLSLDGGFETQPKFRFFGIGNEDELTEPEAVMMPIDPYVDPTAVETRVARDAASARLKLEHDVTPSFGVELSGMWRYSDFRAPKESDIPSVDTIYSQDVAFNYDRPIHLAYVEMELTYDALLPLTRYIGEALPSPGFRAAGFIGFNRVLNDRTANYFRYGLDVNQIFNVYHGDRVIILRAYLEGVTGSLNNVPVIELPRLGGPELLRGFDRDRFRDRASTLATLEYRFPLNRVSAATLFVEVGRVWRTLADFNFDGFHGAFGGAITLFSRDSSVLRAQLAATHEGGAFFQLVLSPSIEAPSRTWR